MDELLAAIRRLPLAKRLELIERAGHEAAADSPTPPSVTAGPTLLGSMGDEPELIDHVCATQWRRRKLKTAQVLRQRPPFIEFSG